MVGVIALIVIIVVACVCCARKRAAEAAARMAAGDPNVPQAMNMSELNAQIGSFGGNAYGEGDHNMQHKHFTQNPTGITIFGKPVAEFGNHVQVQPYVDPNMQY